MGQCIYFTATQYKVTTDSILVRRQLHSHKLEHYRVNCHSFHMMKTGNKKGQSIYSQRFDYPVKNVNAALFIQGN